MQNILVENGFPQIITAEEFDMAAQIKTECCTYRKPALQAESQEPKLTAIEYEPTEEIQRMTNEINRLLDSENPDRNTVEALIIRRAQLKYTTIKEVGIQMRTPSHKNSTKCQCGTRITTLEIEPHKKEMIEKNNP